MALDQSTIGEIRNQIRDGVTAFNADEAVKTSGAKAYVPETVEVDGKVYAIGLNKG